MLSIAALHWVAQNGVARRMGISRFRFVYSKCVAPTCSAFSMQQACNRRGRTAHLELVPRHDEGLHVAADGVHDPPHEGGDAEHHWVCCLGKHGSTCDACIDGVVNTQPR
jgi:hypothetical protein